MNAWIRFKLPKKQSQPVPAPVVCDACTEGMIEDPDVECGCKSPDHHEHSDELTDEEVAEEVDEEGEEEEVF